MEASDKTHISRRKFLEQAALAGGLAAARAAHAVEGRGVSIIVSPDDRVATQLPVRWATEELRRSLVSHGIDVRSHERAEQAAAGHLCLVVAGAESPQAREILNSAKASFPQAPESLAIVPGEAAGRRSILACGGDSRGLAYAVLELADRLRDADDPLAEINLQAPVVEQPLNAVRSVDRCFVSDVEDKPWYNDRSMWPPYLTMLATHRFNRFTLSFGIGYDYPHSVKDAYLYFAYPFLLAVPGYKVRAVGLPDAERDQNLKMLRYISDEAARRGLDFHLGLWNHAYQWPKGSDANYMIEGLAPETHAPYCRDALHAVLKACPGIKGVVLRVHGESGIPEEDSEFWRTLFEGIVKTGRRVEINMHAKGMTQKMIDIALATGLPVTLSPKYWAEHCGLPYQPSSIRQMEMPPRQPKQGGFFTLSSGSRRFLRYSYGDLLKHDRRYGVIFRIWPGTQRCLLWGDPVTAAGDAEAGSFCGSLGIDLFEPLSFKGRHGSGAPGGRCAYEDSSLKPKRDWEKFEYSYCVYGRNLYGPQTDPSAWRRLLRRQFRSAAPAVEKALGNASRVLRVITTARGPSAANNAYWPEVYTNMPIVDAEKNRLYHDTLSPKAFNNVSPFDPQIFSQINGFAQEMLKGNRSGKYSPLEVAQWLEDLARQATAALADAEKSADDTRSPAFRRMALDVSIQSSLGNFFAWKIRSGVLYALFELTKDRSALQEGLTAYRRARGHWAEAANRAQGAYMPDITYGIEENLRGGWLDRLPAIDDDIADMEKQLDQSKESSSGAEETVRRAIREVLSRPKRSSAPCHHTPPRHFKPGGPLPIELSVAEGGAQLRPTLVRLTYRHVNQGEAYEAQSMEAQGQRFRADIPAAYTQSPYALQYFFELHAGPEKAWIYPGLSPSLSQQPYFVVPQIAETMNERSREIFDAHLKGANRTDYQARRNSCERRRSPEGAAEGNASQRPASASTI
jgi:hypothetical protein